MKNHKKIQCMVTFFLFILFAAQASAFITIDIDIKPQFTLGETISFNYTLVSDVDQQIDFLPKIDCPDTAKSLLVTRELQLKEKDPYKDTYTSFQVKYETEPQYCKAVVIIGEPFNVVEEKNFEIVAEPSFDFEILLCKDESCAQRSKKLIIGEEIYLDYDSDVSYPLISAVLVYPDLSIDKITLPTSIRASQIGTYTLEVTASKEGYKTITKTEQFAVIEKAPVIKSVSRCNANNICEDNENHQTCPQDYLSGEADGYCDKISDGKCDPDCETGDYDCEITRIDEVKKEIREKETSYLSIIMSSIMVIFILIVIISVYLFKKAHTVPKDELLKLKEYIAISLDRGFAREQIRNELIKDKWDPMMIKKALSEVKEPKHLTRMQILELENYIMNMLQRGYTKKQITNELIRDGWTQNQIDEAYKNLKFN